MLSFSIAGQEHDESLRSLMRTEAMPGWIKLAYCREPSYFHGCTVQGRRGEVLAATKGNSLVAMGCRSIRQVYVNGEQKELGYLSGLRISSGFRNSMMLARGYAFLRELHQNDPVPAYLTTIVEKNNAAINVLTSKRAGLPHYIDQGRYITYAVCVKRHLKKPSTPAGISLCSGCRNSIDDIVEFMKEEGSRSQFFPAITSSDFDTDYLRGLKPEDFLVAHRGSHILGSMALWNQNAFRQVLVHGYARPVAFFRPALNGLLRVAGFPTMPPPGKYLNNMPVAFVCINHDDLTVFRALLEQMCYKAFTAGGHFLLIGMHERDPLNAAMHLFFSFKYRSRIYLTAWDDGIDFCRDLDGSRVPHLESATL